MAPIRFWFDGKFREKILPAGYAAGVPDGKSTKEKNYEIRFTSHLMD
jgi:hypothetical protein